MKENVVLFSLLFLFIACFNNEQTLNNKKTNHKSYDIKGFWVSETFITKLKSSANSNYAAKDISLSIIHIKNSEEASIIWNFYESTEYSYKNSNDTLILHNKEGYFKFLYNSNEKKIQDIATKNDYIFYENEKILEQELIAGSYMDKNNTLIKLFPNGKIEGLSKYSDYSLEFQNDLVDTTLNIIYLNPETNNLKLAYKIDNEGNIVLYNLNCKDIADDQSCKTSEVFLSLKKLSK